MNEGFSTDNIPNRSELEEFIEACTNPKHEWQYKIALTTPGTPVFIMNCNLIDARKSNAERLDLLLQRLADAEYAKELKEKAEMLKDEISRSQSTDQRLWVPVQNNGKWIQESFKNKSLEELQQWAMALPAQIQALQNTSQALTNTINQFTTQINAVQTQISTQNATQVNNYVSQVRAQPPQFVSTAAAGRPVVSLPAGRIEAVQQALNEAGTLADSLRFNQELRKFLHQQPEEQAEKIAIIHDNTIALLRAAFAYNSDRIFGEFPSFVHYNKVELDKVPQCNPADKNNSLVKDKAHLLHLDRQKFGVENKLNEVKQNCQRLIQTQDAIREEIADRLGVKLKK